MGRIRGHHFGEGEYDASEQTIRQLLTEAGHTNLPVPASGQLQATGVEAAADEAHIRRCSTAHRAASRSGSVHATCTW
jgi:hypothetical protein